MCGFFLTNSKLYRTTDAGYSWVSYSTGVGNREMSFVTENTGWICDLYTFPYPPPYGTNYSQIRRTDNGGQSWNVQVNIQEQSFSIDRIFFYDINSGFYNGFVSSSLSHTVTGGSSWGAGSAGAGFFKNYYEMSFSSNNYGWFIGDQLIKTSDAGYNWRTMSTSFGTNFNNVFFVNDTIGWLVGNGGLIIKTKNGGEPVIGVNPITNIVNFFSLSQNYPNPFNPITRIKFDIPKSSHMQIAVYDILGREVQQLLNEDKKPGSYEITWDGSRFASGIYFYKIISDNFMETKKMVLLK
jgi:hypothetical protein